MCRRKGRMEPTDIQLMLRVRQSDVEAFRTLAERYREPLRRYFASLIAERSQADDCAGAAAARADPARRRGAACALSRRVPPLPRGGIAVPRDRREAEYSDRHGQIEDGGSARSPAPCALSEGGSLK